MAESEDIDKVHEQALKHERKMHDYGLSGKGTDIGGIAVAHDQAVVNPDIDPETGKKKKDSLLDELLKLTSLDDWKMGMNDIVGEMNDKVDDLAASLRVTQRLQKAKADGDIGELRIILAEQGVDVGRLSDDQIVEATDNEFDLQETKQETLIQEIKDLAAEFKEGMQNENIPQEEKQIYAHKLAAIRLKAEGIEGLDFKDAFKDCFKLDADNEFYELGVRSNDSSDYATFKKMTNQYNDQASIINDTEMSNDMNLDMEDDLGLSVNSGAGDGLTI